MNSLLHSAAPPSLVRGQGLRLNAAAPTLWRVVDRTGVVVGHLEAVAGEAGVRYRAQRFHALTRTFRILGDFWSADDAVECLRLAR